MNFTELKSAILSDAHREDYTDHVDRFVAEAEARIFATLVAYNLEVTLSDADRVVTDENIYNLPDKLVQVRHVFYNKFPLDEIDESFIWNWRQLTTVYGYCVRPKKIAIVGNPGPGTTIDLHYWGIPPALVGETDTNTLLNEYPHLYKTAAMISVFQRSQDFDLKQQAENDTNTLIKQINTKVKRQMGGARSSNPYNVEFRSSY